MLEDVVAVEVVHARRSVAARSKLIPSDFVGIDARRRRRKRRFASGVVAIGQDHRRRSWSRRESEQTVIRTAPRRRRSPRRPDRPFHRSRDRSDRRRSGPGNGAGVRGSRAPPSQVGTSPFGSPGIAWTAGSCPVVEGSTAAYAFPVTSACLVGQDDRRRARLGASGRCSKDPALGLTAADQDGREQARARSQTERHRSSPSSRFHCGSRRDWGSWRLLGQDRRRDEPSLISVARAGSANSSDDDVIESPGHRGRPREELDSDGGRRVRRSPA